MNDIKKHVSFRDVSLNDIDKEITAQVGSKNPWQLLWAHVTMTTTATVGNRLISVIAKDADSNELLDLHAGSYQAASSVYHYEFLQGIFRETVSSVAPAGDDGTIQVPLPIDFIIPAGYNISFADMNAIDTNDDMLISGMVRVLRH